MDMKARLSIVCVVTLVAAADVGTETGPLADAVDVSRLASQSLR